MDKIVHTMFINLDERKDRLENVNDELKKIGINDENITRFSAIKLKNGRIGCSMSHLKCLQTAKNNKWKNVFICEDDIKFTRPNIIKKQLQKFFENTENKNWDVCIIAGNNVPPYEKIGNYCIKVSHCQTTTGYIVNEHYYDTLIDNFKTGIQQLMKFPDNHIQFAIDKYWIMLQKQHNWFMIIPATVVQRPDFSDIEQKLINYDYLMLDIDKKSFLNKAN